MANTTNTTPKKKERKEGEIEIEDEKGTSTTTTITKTIPTLNKIESIRLRHLYPDKIPVLCYQCKHDTSGIAKLNRNKFLVAHDLQVSEFQYVIRKQIKLKDAVAFFLFCGDHELHWLPANMLMSAVDKKYQSQDGYLRLTYSGENAFGCFIGFKKH